MEELLEHGDTGTGGAGGEGRDGDETGGHGD
jgi:hypothetical protein